MIAQVSAPAPALRLLPAIAPSVGHYVMLVNKRTGEGKTVEVWTSTDSFAAVCAELVNVRIALNMPRSEWEFEGDTAAIDAPF